MRALVLCALALALTGCPSLPPAPEGDLTWPQRQRLLSAEDSFATSGRLSLTVPEQTSQASFDLAVEPGDLALQLSGPLGFGAMRLEVRDGQGRLISSRHGDIALQNTEEELTALLGYPVPLEAIRYWALGLPQPGRPARQEWSPDGLRLSVLEQAGWRVEFQNYRAVSVPGSPGGSRVDLPRKVLLTGPDVRILMVFRDWRF